MFTKHNRKAVRNRTHRRIRSKIMGTSVRPRLCVYRSLNHIYAQLIDDVEGKTLAATSSLDPNLRSELNSGANIEAAQLVGKALADKAKEKGIKKVVFDRNGFRYHGRIAALANSARENGIEF